MTGCRCGGALGTMDCLWIMSNVDMLPGAETLRCSRGEQPLRFDYVMATRIAPGT